MFKTSRNFICLCSAAGLVFALAAQEKPKKPQLTARQLFYSAVQPEKAEAPKPPSQPKPPKKGPTAPKGPSTAQNATPPPAPPDNVKPPRPVASAPLGLRYTVVKITDTAPSEVPADTTFHTGDHAQLKVQANSPGYLYVVSQGTTGMWKPIFPSPEVEKGDNHVEALRSYTLPSEEQGIGFDENSGPEKIFIVLCRQPEPDLEKLIYSLKGGSPRESKQLAGAQQTRIDDATVGRIREAYARDLIIEWVKPSSSAEKKETAVYVVNPNGSSDSRVVADLSLTHK